MPKTQGKAKATKAKASAKHGKPVAAPRGGDLKPVEKRVIEIIAELRETYGTGDIQRHVVAIFAGYPKADTPGFVKVLGTLKKKGYIVFTKQTITLTAKGTAAAGPVEPRSVSTAEVHQRLKSHLKPVEVRVFDYLADGKAHSKEDMAEALGYDSAKQPGYVKVLGKMKSIGFVEYPDSTTARLADLAFPSERGGGGGGSSRDSNSPAEEMHIRSETTTTAVSTPSGTTPTSARANEDLVFSDGEAWEPDESGEDADDDDEAWEP